MKEYVICYLVNLKKSKQKFEEALEISEEFGTPSKGDIMFHYKQLQWILSKLDSGAYASETERAMEMNLRFSESEIGYWANRYMERQREKGRTKEQQLIDLKDKVLQRGYLTKEELHKIARWKSPRRANLTLENTDDFTKEITERAFTATDSWTKLLALTQLRGIGQPTASAILHLFDKGQYPILDIHALWSVGLPWKTRNSYPFWLEYIEFCRDIANRNSVSMRELDRALWKFSSDHGKEGRSR